MSNPAGSEENAAEQSHSTMTPRPYKLPEDSYEGMSYGVFACSWETIESTLRRRPHPFGLHTKAFLEDAAVTAARELEFKATMIRAEPHETTQNSSSDPTDADAMHITITAWNGVRERPGACFRTAHVVCTDRNSVVIQTRRHEDDAYLMYGRIFWHGPHGHPNGFAGCRPCNHLVERYDEWQKAQQSQSTE